MNQKSFPIFFIFLLTFFLIFTGCIEHNEENQNNPLNFEFSKKYQAQVIKVIDGDTIDIQYQNDTTIRIRLLGIDTPETQPNQNTKNEYQNITNLECLTQWGKKATNYTTEVLSNQQIYIEFDQNAGFKGGYGRWLSYVYLTDGSDFNKMLLKNGYARVYTSESFSKKENYLQNQQNAINEKQGLWNCKK